MSNARDEKLEMSSQTLSSEDLAALIVDALLRANIVQKENVERAMKIVVEEIEVRKVLGDY